MKLAIVKEVSKHILSLYQTHHIIYVRIITNISHYNNFIDSFIFVHSVL